MTRRLLGGLVMALLVMLVLMSLPESAVADTGPPSVGKLVSVADYVNVNAMNVLSGSEINPAFTSESTADIPAFSSEVAISIDGSASLPARGAPEVAPLWPPSKTGTTFTDMSGYSG